MVVNKQDSPKIIALSLAVVSVLAFIGVTLARANREDGEEKARVRNANLLLDFPDPSVSAGAMVLWQSQLDEVTNPFRLVFSEGPPPRPTNEIQDGARPVDPLVAMNVAPPPLCVLKGVLTGESDGRPVAVFAVGVDTKLITVGEALISRVFVERVRPDGAVLKKGTERYFVPVNGTFTPPGS